MVNLRLKALLAGLLMISAASSYSASYTDQVLAHPKLALATLGALTFGFHQLCRYISTPDSSLPTLEDINPVTIAPLNSAAQAIEQNEEIIALLSQKRLDNLVTINNKKYHVQTGVSNAVKDNDIINLYVGGCFNGGRSQIHAAYNGYKKATMDGLTITMDITTHTQKRYDFCQEQDLYSIDLIISEIIKINPQAKIILRGPSKGGSCVALYLSYLAKTNSKLLNHIIGAIIAEPVVSTQSVLGKFPGVHGAARLILPNYHPDKPNLLTMTKFPANIPIFMARLEDDWICNKEELIQVIKRLKEELNCNNIQFKQYPNPDKLQHGKIGLIPEFQADVKEFIKQIL